MQDTNPLIERAISLFGSQKKLADELGCSQQQISLMASKKIRVTAEMALKIDEVTKGFISKHALRPDIFGKVSATEAAE